MTGWDQAKPPKMWYTWAMKNANNLNAMAGTSIGSLKGKMGLKGKLAPGAMITRMNQMKAGAASGAGRLEKAVKTKPQGKGIVKALGQGKTTGNFKRLEKAKGKGAAIGALQNKLARVRGKKIPYGKK